MNNYCLSKDAGQLFVRNREIEKKIKDIKSIITVEINSNKLLFSFGMLDAYEDCKNNSHRELVDKIIETKKKNYELSSCDDLLDEKPYLDGYLMGIENILKIDRKIFKLDTSFVFIVYSISEEIISKYRLSLYASDLFSEVESVGYIKYYISTNADEICNVINHFDEKTEYVICVVYNKETLPNKEIMQQLAFGRNNNVYLLRDKENTCDSVNQAIRKLIEATVI